MRTIKSMAVAVLCVLALAACKKEEPQVVVAWTPASTSATFNLGESQNITATAENIDYVEVSSKPEGWTVNATVTSISIKAPAGTEASFAFDGSIELKAVNREEEKTIPATISVSIDQSKISGIIEIKSDVKYATTFQPGETIDFDYTSAFLKSIDVACDEGWSATIDESASKISVTAPAVEFGQKVNLSSEITLSGKAITGKDVDPVSFDVVLEAYLVSADDFTTDYAAYGVYDEDGEAIAFAAYEYDEIDGSEEEVPYSLFVYMLTDGGLGDGCQLPEGISAVFFKNGAVTADYDGEPLKVTNAPYMVKDVEGNEYSTAYFDGYLWMAENLRTATAPDGSALDESGYASPNLDDANIEEYGRLYNKTVAFNGGEPGNGYLQGICPDGWHLPEDFEISSEVSLAEAAAQTVSIVDGQFNPLFYEFLKSQLAGLYMYAPMMGGGRALMFDQAGSYQMANASYIFTVLPAYEAVTGKNISYQKYSAYYAAIRCVKNTAPFAVETPESEAGE